MMSYTLKKADGSDAPDYYQVSQNGLVTFRTDGSSFVDDDLIIVIEIAGGKEVITQETAAFNVATRCGPGSTMVTIDEPMQTVRYAANQIQNQLVAQGIFTSSNLLCPVETQVLEQGATHFSLNVEDDHFFVSLRSAYSS